MSHSKWTKDTGPLTPDRLAELVASYGASPDHWPEHEREPAEKCLAQSGQAQEALAEAAALDDMLDSLVPPVPSSRLRSDLMAAMPVKSVSRPRRAAHFGEIVLRSLGSAFAPRPALMLASMAAIFVIGVTVGWVAALQPGSAGVGENFVFSLVGGGDDDVMISGAELSPQIFDGDLIVALH